jgi:hypothetical protein
MSVAVERRRLDQLEAVIERGIETFVAVGEALMEIRDSRLYKQTHSSFDAYCKERWGFSRRRGYQLIAAAQVVEEVCTGGTQIAPADSPRDRRRGWVEGTPQNERQARALKASLNGDAPPPLAETVSVSEAPAVNVSERDFQQTVTDALTAFGWRWVLFRPARTERGWRTALSGSPGYPDISAVRGDRILFVELKSANGKMRDEQRAWLSALGAAGAEIHCWRASDEWSLIEEQIR